MQTKELIGQGATAEVFSIDSAKVFKLYRKFMPREAVELEYKAAKAAESCGINVARALDIAEQDGRYGIVFERVAGQSMLKSIILPWQVRKNAILFAKLQYKMHQASPQGLPPYKKYLSIQIERTQMLTDNEKNKVLKLLDGLPDGKALCHGDFHPDNIVLTMNGPVIIDWMTACTGCAAADVSRSCLVLDSSQLPGNIPMIVRMIINHVRKRFCSGYIKEYQSLSGCTTEEINEWRVPLAAARLDECRPPKEQELLLSIVRGYTDRPLKAEK